MSKNDFSFAEDNELLGSDDSGLVDNDEEFAELERQFEVFELQNHSESDEMHSLKFSSGNIDASNSNQNIDGDNENFTLELNSLRGISQNLANGTVELPSTVHSLQDAEKLVAQLETEKLQNEKLDADCTDLRKQLQSSNLKSERMAEEKDRLLARITKLESDMSALKAKDESQKQSMESIRSEKEQEMRTFRRQLLEEKNRQLEDLSAQLLKSQGAREKHLESSVMRLEKLLTESQQRQVFLEQKIALLNTQLQESSIEKEKQIEKIAQLQRERIDLQDQLDRIEVSSDQPPNDRPSPAVAALEIQVQQLEHERVSLIDKSNEESRTFQSVARMFVDRLLSLKSEFEHVVDRVDVTAESFERKFARLPPLVDALINLKGQMDENEAVKALLGQIAALSQTVEDLETNKLIIESEKQRLERQLAEANENEQIFKDDLRQKANDAFVAALQKVKASIQHEKEQLSLKFSDEIEQLETRHKRALADQHQRDISQLHDERMAWSAREAAFVDSNNRNREKYLTTLRKMRDDLNVFKNKCLHRMEQEWKKRKLKLETAHVHETLDLKRMHAKEIAALLSTSKLN